MPEDDSLLGQNEVDVRNEARRDVFVCKDPEGDWIRDMTEELKPLGEIMIPVTGELVSLAELAEVCRALDQVRDIKRQLDDVRAELEHALRVESERQGTKTLHLDGLTAVVSGGEKTEYDETALADELRDLGLPEQRIGELVVATITYRVDQRVAKSVAGANPRYAEAIERHRRVVPAAWRVSVKRGA